MARTFPVPAGTKRSSCRTCSAPVFWIVTPRGKRMPVDPGGVSHFETCAQADEHRRPTSSAPVRESLVVPPLDPPIERGPFKAYRRSDAKIAIVDGRRRLGDGTVRLVMSEEAAEPAVLELAEGLAP
jgi:hypothetical protein